MNLKKPKDCTSLEEVRAQIDKIDEQIIQLLSLRHGYVEEVVNYKDNKEGVIAAARKEQVIEQRADQAAKLGLDPVTIREMYTTLIDRNIQHELDLLQKKVNS